MSADPSALSPIKRAFLALEAAEAKLAAHEAAAREPIAVVGVGCRVPGAEGPEALWRLLAEGRDAVGPIPRERFDIERFFDPDTEQPGRIAVREAGFLSAPVADFDAAFFGISPREARGMDPQQRLMLEVAWEALEHAGIAPDRLSGSSTGVFVGQASSDWATMLHKAGDPALFDAHFTSGVAHSVTSGRLSYLLGLQGPSLTVDTACSSSLVAVHLACQSLRAGECRMALAGGVNLMLSEDLFIAFSHSRMLAPDGRCKTFDASADGFGRGEGCGVVVLKRLADARADGDRILALIRGSAVNQDGPSSGLTAPNGPQQEAVIRAALLRGGLVPADVGFVEAHGTGTQLGDPLEVQALANVFGPGRDRAQPLSIGSIKTNLGHLEAAAGITGLIKLVLALQQRAIPAHLHWHTPSPHIDWQGWPVAVPTALQPWAPIGGRRIGGVSSFGYSGTNAHVVVEEAPAVEAVAVEAPKAMLYTLSARSEAALRTLAQRHRDALDATPAATLEQACRTANAGRAAFAQRASIVASTRDELRERLDALAAGRAIAGLRTARLQRREPPRIAFVFTGQGSQHAGMAHGLYDTVPAFRAALDRCAAALEPWLDVPLHELLFGAANATIDHTAHTQPALFAVGFALAETWRAFGIAPMVLLGHSVGEIAAACVAGVFTLKEAARLVGERARRMGALPAGGAMAAVSAPQEAVVPHLQRHPGVGIAAANAPTQTVVSGTAEAVAALCADLAAQGLRCQPLTVSHAFHSGLMEPMLDGFEQALQGLKAAPPRLRIVSNLDGALAGAGTLAAPRYWRRQVREPVRFADGVRTLLAQQPDICVEIGPQPALLGFVGPVAPELPRIASLRKGRPERETLLDALASLWLEGAPVDWRAVHEGDAGAPLAWPTYPFERERCWFNARPAAPPAPAGAQPLLGARVRSATPQRLHAARVAADAPGWVAQHRVNGRVVLPGTAWLDLLLAAAQACHGSTAGGVADATLPQALVLDDTPRLVQTLIDPVQDGAAAVRVASLPVDAADDAAWTTHATARLPASTEPWPAAASLDAARQACTETVEPEAFYADFAARGLDFGPAFRSLAQIRRGAGQACGEVRLHADLDAERGRWQMHPVLLDGCVQLLAVAVSADAGDLYLPLAIGRYRLLRRPTGPVWAHVVATAAAGRETRRADVQVFDADGTPIAQLLDVQLKRVTARMLSQRTGSGIDPLPHEIAWRDWPRPQPLPTPAELAAVAAAAGGPLASACGLDAYDAALPALDRLCAAYIAQALVALGQPAAPGTLIDADALPVLPRHRQLLARLLAILVEQGWLVRDGTRWRVARDLATAQPQADTPELRPCMDERTMTQRTGSGLAAALRGAADPLQLLFPGGDSSAAERVYRDAPPARFFNGLVAEVVAAAAQARRAARPLRILEIGAGTGGTTAHVLPRLAAGTARYTFTDVGNAFVMRARERFGTAAVETAFQVFDLERDGAPQGLADGAHDLVIASNVVHATRDLRASLRRIRRLLAPGGLLVMLEACAPQAWFDVTVGLTEGWWAFEDRDLRPDYATLPRQAWLQLLREDGFAAEAVEGDPATPGARGLNVLLVARREAAPRHWLVVGEAGDALAQALRTQGDACTLVASGQALPDLRVDGVVHAAALDARDAQAIGLDALRVAQDLATRPAPPRLWLLTRGAQASAGTDACEAPQAAVLWGLARTLRLEHPELRATTIDADAGGSLDALATELRDDADEPERALRGTARRVPRLVPMTRPARDAAPASWRLVPTQRGSLEAFVREPMVRRAPGPGEVEVAVEATGLNFKDVLNVLGLYPGEAGPLGAECAGRVAALGAGVEGLAVGDAVLALAGGSFASHVVAPAAMVRRLPAGVGMAEGASFAVAHLTAAFCLDHLAGLRAGQTVLVHAAAGGVGLAALRIARLAGATVYATAGAAWKHDLVRELGAERVFDSRSAAFLDGVRAATGGRGVDVVLNSLAGELIEPSFAALADGGCFVEIGKRGIKTSAEVAAMDRGIRYHVVDWGETAAREPALIGGLLERLVERLADGSLPPLPRHDFDLGDAPRAFRFMAQARHAGRITLRHVPAEVWQPSARGSYLVTGGLSGLGLAVARWLGERGAGRLVLVGRRGVTPEAAPVLDALRARGVAVVAEALDVSHDAALAALLRRIRADGPPLRGVFHSAGVLDEASVLQQDAARFATVFAPKLRGAQALDRLTRADALDAFVLFSSIAGVLGAAGQANHAAASAFLDALAHDRRARGLPALSIDWGAWGEVGAAAREGVGQRLAAQGLATFGTAEGLAALERLMAHGVAQAAVLAVDWETWRRQRGAPQPLLDEIARRPLADAPTAKPAPAVDVLADLRQAPPARRRALMTAFVRERALRVLGLDAGHALDPRAPLGDLGLDSLLAVELRNALAGGLGASLPATLLFDHPTVEALASHLLEEIFPILPQSVDARDAASPAPARTIVDAVADLSDDEVDRRLAALKRAKT